MFIGITYSLVQPFILESIPMYDFLQRFSSLLYSVGKLFEDSPPELTKHIWMDKNIDF